MQPISERSTEEVPVAAPSAARWATRTLRNMAAQDWYIALYFTLLTGALAFGSGPGRQHGHALVAIDFTCFWIGIVLTRGGILRFGSFANGVVYRLTVFCSVFLSYFQLREILPAVTSRSEDAAIYAFDLKVFGFEPAMSWDRYVNPHTTEWFAFFYFGYFFLIAAHVLPMVFGARNMTRLTHFSFGMVFVFCSGHLGYLLVPGWGPYRHFAGQFEHELSGGLFWGLVKTTVEAGGAMKDIFPSLHTAGPTFLALFSFRYRKALPFRYTWPFVAACVTQIIVATMFLRWHYLIDICAGLTVATTALLLGEVVTRWEKKRRTGDLPGVYAELPWRKSPVDSE